MARRNNSTTVTQIHRFLALIEYTAARESVDLEELALVGGVSRATIYRMLHEMREALGASIAAGADGRYRLVSAGVVRMPACWCEQCALEMAAMRGMSLCPACGDKRCPRAQDHRHTCGDGDC